MIAQQSEQEKSKLFNKIKVMANTQRFKILELTQNKSLSITELSSKIQLSYNKCADYVKILEVQNLVNKTKIGKEVRIKSSVSLAKNKIEFN